MNLFSEIYEPLPRKKLHMTHQDKHCKSTAYAENKFTVEDEVILLRYFTLVKFEKRIKDQSIYFCRADKFDDPLEGRTPTGTIREMYRSSPPFVAGAVQMVRDMFRGKTYGGEEK